MKHRTFAAAALMSWLFGASTGLAGGGASAKDIVDTAVGAGQFNTLVTAVKAAGLVETLKGNGPFTVFAPTDEAFAKLPKGTLEDLLKPENKDKLASILTYHVVPSKLMAADVTKARGAASVQGQWISLTSAGGAVMADGAKIVKTDIACSNGVIHVIDAVILPEDANLVKVAGGAETFKTLLAAATAAGLADTLATGGPFTVFAPTDEAFAKLPKGALEDLLKPANKEKLAGILKYHIVANRVYSDAVVGMSEAKTLQGGVVKIQVKGGKVMLNDATVSATDVDASNGVIHVIDTVLMPG